MKLNSGRIALLGALVAAVLAATGHIKYLNDLQETVRVVVVTKEVEAFQMLDQSNMTLREMPASAVGSGAIIRLEDAMGQYTRGLLVAGDIVRRAHLVEASGGALAARLTTTGDRSARAMAVRVSAETGVANTLQAGDKVDLLVAVQVERSNGTAAKIIAQGVPVIFTSFGKDEAMNGGNRDGTVVLQVVPEVAEELAFAQTSGTIWLLTTPYDAEAQETAGVNADTFRIKYPVAAETKE